MTGPSTNSRFSFAGKASGAGMLGAISTTAALMKLFPGAVNLSDGTTFVTSGRTAAGDGGGATFRYDALDAVAPDNGGTLRIDNAGRRWHAANVKHLVSIQIFGAVADGEADCSVAIVAANSWVNPEGPSGCLIPPGKYRVANSVVLRNRLQGAGGMLVIAEGKTLTLGAAPDGPLQQMFDGHGRVIIGAVSALGYPEWFGAIPNEIGFDCTAAINTCIAVFPITQFQRTTYFHDSTINYTTSGRRIQGMPERNQTDTGTTLAVKSATLDSALVGSAKDPGAINSYAHNIDIYGIWHTRTVPVAPPKAGNPVTQTASWRIQYGLNIYMDTCQGSESSAGFIYSNIVKSYFRRCQGKRAINGASSANDVWNGHYLNGFGLSYLSSCTFDECGSDYNASGCTSSIGLTAVGCFTDCYVNGFEADAHDISVLLDGTGSTKPSIDCYISGGVFDQVKKYGFYCLNQPAGSQIHVAKSYAVCTSTGVAGFMIENNAGTVSLIGNQSSGLGAGQGVPTLCGLKIVNSGMVNSAGNMWSEFDGAIDMAGAYACQIHDAVSNKVQSSKNPAITLVNCHSNLLQPNIDAPTIGVMLDNRCENNEINTSAINGLTTKGKLAHESVVITAPGLFGKNNLASGLLR